MRDCARTIDGQYCGCPFTTTRLIELVTVSTAPADLAYTVDLCEEHADEYDRNGF